MRAAKEGNRARERERRIMKVEISPGCTLKCALWANRSERIQGETRILEGRIGRRGKQKLSLDLTALRDETPNPTESNWFESVAQSEQ